MLVDVSTVVTTAASNILDVTSETRVQGGEAAFQFTVQLVDKAQLDAMVGQILRLPGVTRVLRASLRELKRQRSTTAFWDLADSATAYVPACDVYDSQGSGAG